MDVSVLITAESPSDKPNLLHSASKLPAIIKSAVCCASALVRLASI